MLKSFHKPLSARQTALQDIFHSDQHELASEFFFVFNQGHTVNATVNNFIEAC